MCFKSKDAAYAEVCRERDALKKKLAAYENTGVTPEEIVHIKNGIERVWKLQQDIDKEKLKHIEELVAAENEGRLVVLKCVPALKPYMKNTLYIIDDGEVFDDFVTEVNMGENGNGELVAAYIMCEGDVFTENDFGKTVFLTEEEAQKALAADTNVGGKYVVDLFDEEGGEILNG